MSPQEMNTPVVRLAVNDTISLQATDDNHILFMLSLDGNATSRIATPRAVRFLADYFTVQPQPQSFSWEYALGEHHETYSLSHAYQRSAITLNMQTIIGSEDDGTVMQYQHATISTHTWRRLHDIFVALDAALLIDHPPQLLAGELTMISSLISPTAWATALATVRQQMTICDWGQPQAADLSTLLYQPRRHGETILK